MRPTWDFEYAPTQSHASLEPSMTPELVVATRAPTPAERVASVLGGVEVEVLIDRAPIHWLLVRAAEPLSLADATHALTSAGLELRYVASTRHPSQRLGAPLEWRQAWPAAPDQWPAREHAIAADVDHPHRWFVEENGVDVDRGLCGFGCGTRIAVLDNDAGRSGALGLDALVSIARPPPDPSSVSCHAAALIAWAVGGADPAFAGIAPGASPRLYCVPKPGNEVVAVPLAIARAVLDGADVVVCATYLEGATSPMLDDALEVALRLGRGGKGTALVFAVGREIGSPDRLVPSSLSLDLGDPASDPRVFCIGPSGRHGGWFLFADRRGRIRPFGNRGPAVRFLSPGDDAADPFLPSQLRHTESSGATAFAAGVMLLVLATAPKLTVGELEAILTMTARRTDPAADIMDMTGALASELLPSSTDRDGHNAKHGYGRLDATTACCAARDPLALLLASVGEPAAARAWIGTHELFSAELGRALVCALLASDRLRHAGAVLVRHLRLIAHVPRRFSAHAPGAVLRHVAVLLRDVAAEVCDESTRAELVMLAERARRATDDAGARAAFDGIAADLAAELWPDVLQDDVATNA